MFLSWTSAVAATGYAVYRSLTDGGPYTLVTASLTTTTYSDTGRTNGVTYYYVVTATNISGTSDYSNQASATPQVTGNPIDIQPNPPFGYLPDPMTQVSWMSDTEPIDTADAAQGPSGAISVSLAHGVANVDSGLDLEASNPYGPDVSFGRLYRTAMAAANLSSPGLPRGWTHNWDFWIVPKTSGTWGDLQFVYPNGASETISPILMQGSPTGYFTVPNSAPYKVTGTPSNTSPGVWTQITFSHNGSDREVYTMLAGDSVYRLTSKYFSNGTQLIFNYSAKKLVSIQSQAPGIGTATLLTLTYSTGTPGYLQNASSTSGGIRSYAYTNGELDKCFVAGG